MAGDYFGVPYVGIEWVTVMDVKNLDSVILYYIRKMILNGDSVLA